MKILLFCMDRESSRVSECHLAADGDGIVVLELESGKIEYQFQDLVFSSRLGNTPRRIEFPDNRLCETEDNSAVDMLLQKHGVENNNLFLHLLESRLRYVFTAVVITVLVTMGTVSYGIPALAKQVAFLVPLDSSSTLGDDVLAALDGIVLEATKLSEQERQVVSSRFLEMSSNIKGGYSFSLVFRDGGEMGANAIALPTGTIVVTDQLVKQAEDLHEIEAILAHEIGHIIHRHSLRELVQVSTVGLLIMAITGDLSTISALSASLPTILVETHYSREFEREADQYAYDYLVQNDISPVHFRNIIQRITEGEESGGFLSTHPSVAERSSMFYR